MREGSFGDVAGPIAINKVARPMICLRREGKGIHVDGGVGDGGRHLNVDDEDEKEE